MSDHRGQQILVLANIWWWQKLRRNYQWIKISQISYREAQSQEVNRRKG
jgi:hypothetical protein